MRFIEPGGRAGRPFNAWITRWPLLGGITLATVLDSRGYDAGVYNENISGPLEENEPAKQDLLSADVIGIGIMTATARRGYELARWIKQAAPQITVVLGGVHATMLPNEAIQYADVVVCGEGETVIESIAGGQITSGIIRAEPLADLDTLPALNHFLMRDFDKLLKTFRKRCLYELPVMTSRGCPHDCTYCSVTRMFGRKVRRQSVDKVLRDLEHYASQGFKQVFFYDDNFITDRAWTVQLLERMRPMRMEFKAQSRIDFHWLDRQRRQRDQAMLKAMYKGGARLLFVGYETLDEATAKGWHKGYAGATSLEQRMAEDTRILHDAGLWLHGMFVLGPQHTAATAEHVIDFAQRVRMETLQMSILTPFPGTPLLEQMRPHLFFNDFPRDWDFFDGAHCVYDHGHLGIEGTQRAVLSAHERFYRHCSLNPRVIRAQLGPRPLTMVDKLRDMWWGMKAARDIMRDWRKEIGEYAGIVQQRRGHVAKEVSVPLSLEPIEK
jgi:anaerobic magnesium-protoporphyrin IX monomethyl ester cyclase